MHPRTLVFHVIFTPGTVASLQPFVVSLLDRTACRFRLVANGCAAREIQLLARLCAGEPRLELVRRRGRRPADHGVVLDELFSREESDWFAFLDSDVFAVGDVGAEIAADLERGAAVFGGAPLWSIAADEVVPAGSRVLAGPQNRLADGRPIGGSYFAVYPRARVAECVRAIGVGFRKVLAFESLPDAVQDTLERLGARADHYETGKLLNLLLGAAGCELVVRELTAIRHVGGLSLLARREARRKPAPRPAGGATPSGDRSNGERPWMARKHAVCDWMTGWIRALETGNEHAAELAVTEPDVRARVFEARDRLVELYRGESLREHTLRAAAADAPRPVARAWWNLRRRLSPAARPLSTEGIYVLGMHRSGTSLLAGLLETSGLWIGRVERAAKHNPRGNLEDERVRTVNKDLLLQFGGTWDHPPRLVAPDVIDPRPLRGALEPFRAHDRWAVKDPRLLLLLDAWLPHTPRHRLLGTFRHPGAVARSLQRRNGMPRADGVRLWCRYNRELVARHRARPFPLLDFDLDEETYLHAYEQACARLDLPVDVAAARAARVPADAAPADEPAEVEGEAAALLDYLQQHRVTDPAARPA